MTDVGAAEIEEAIRVCVREFYGKTRQDPLLGPIFNNNWDVHLRVIANFWSKASLQTARYNGSPFVLHRNLPIEVEHFERWLALFEETVNGTLPVEYSAKALAKARHMAESFKVGIVPFVDKDGNPPGIRNEAEIWSQSFYESGRKLLSAAQKGRDCRRAGYRLPPRSTLPQAVNEAWTCNVGHSHGDHMNLLPVSRWLGNRRTNEFRVARTYQK